MAHTARNFTNEPIVEANVTESEYINAYQAKKDEKAFVQHSPLLAVLKQSKTLKGKEMEFVYKLSNSATTSAGYVHCASTAGKSKKIRLVSKKLYAYTDVDGETMEIFKKDPESVIASFSERFLDDASMAFRYNLERQLMCNDLTGSGLLDTVTAVAGTGTNADPYVVDLAADSIVEKFNCGDLLHKEDDGLDGADKDGLLQLKIVEVIEADPVAATPVQLKLVGNPSSAVVAGDELYKASSKGHELIGLRGLLLANAGDTVYGTTLDPQMTATKLDVSTYAAGNRGVSSRMFRDMFRKIKKKVGEYPDIVLTSHEVFRDLEEILDGSKTFFIQWNSGTKQGIVPIGFNGVEFVIGGKTIRVVETEYLKKGEAMILNTKHMELKWRNGGMPKWDSRDGTVFRTTTCDDSFSARYIAYGEFMANAGYMGIITGIETSDLLAE
jgi:hypothetical protein